MKYEEENKNNKNNLQDMQLHIDATAIGDSP